MSVRPPKNTEASRAADPSSVIEVIGVQRRAPFGDNPSVGARGTRTQHRILRAALEVFGEVGYEACGVERITEAAGCSRPSFYQYFSSKEDLFRQLAGEVARALFGIVEEMGRVTPDADGWKALRQWLEAYADLYEHYQPVFDAFVAAQGSDAVVASGAARVARRQIGSLAAKIDPEAFKSDAPEVVAGILLNAVNRANRYEQLLVRIAPHRAPDRARLLDSLADVLHRSLFGRRGVAMVAYRPAEDAPRRPAVPEAAEVAGSAPIGPAGRRTRSKILDAGAAELAARGYHETRVDDIVATAGVSHGTFYRYFDNKEHVFRVIAGRAGRRVFRALSGLPDIAGEPSSQASSRRLRRWMVDYAATWAEEGPIFRLWVGALGRDRELNDLTVRAFDTIRARLGQFLSPRGFGDTDVDAFLLLALLDLTPYGPRDAAALERSARVVVAVVRRGFLGVDAKF